MKSSLCILLLLCIGNFAFSQQENYNKEWVQGAPRTFKTTFTTAGPVNQFWDSVNIQSFANGHSNICTGTGELLLATDGGDIYNSDRQIIDNGDTICTDLLYDGVISFPMQTTIILPLGDSIYYVFNTNWSDSIADHFGTAQPDQVLYHVVDMKQNGYTGKVVKKKQVAIDNVKLAASNMTAVRHGNGTDWWLVKHGAVTNGNSHKIYTCLVKKDTVLGPYVQVFPNTANGVYFGSWIGQSAFNNTGTKYAAVDEMQYLFTVDFDRCTGVFSNANHMTVPMGSSTDHAPSGVCFSPNDSLLYVTNMGSVFQLELNNPDSATAWYYVAGFDTIMSYFNQYVSLQMGHDQKIYIGNVNNLGSTMSVINNPNGRGTLADFCPKCLRFPKFMNTNVAVSQPPNMPNYVLGIDPKCPPIPSGIATINESNTFKLYPNPATSSVSFEYSLGGGLFEIMDMMGRVLISEKAAIGSKKSTLSIETLVRGIYVYRYSIPGSGSFAGRLIVR